MKESLWGYWIVVLGIAIASIMILVQNLTTTSEQDYYLIKSCLEASMYEAIDYGYYRDTGALSINAEKLVENFYRRFSETLNIEKTYRITFYDIYEEPPAASVEVTTLTDESNFGNSNTKTESTNVTNRLTGILFTNKDAHGTGEYGGKHYCRSGSEGCDYEAKFAPRS